MADLWIVGLLEGIIRLSYDFLLRLSPTFARVQ